MSFREAGNGVFFLEPGFTEPEKIAPVSVIIPCYRAATTIARALASVAAQRRRPCEVIVVDDGSDDDTLEILSQLVKEYGPHWLKVFSLKKNRGPATARNYGWERATQPLIAFLDADDAWHPDKLVVQCAFMEKHPEITLCGHRCSTPETLAPRIPLQVRFFECTLIGLLYSNSLKTQSVMLRRGITSRFPEGWRYAEDYNLWLSVVGAGGRAAVLDLALTAMHKPAFGAGGLSAALWCMERGELDSLLAVWRQRQIPFSIFVGAMVWSLLKFIRRLWLTGCRRRTEVKEYCAKILGKFVGKSGDCSGLQPSALCPLSLKTGMPSRPSSLERMQPTILFLVTDDWFFLIHRKALAVAAQEVGFKVLVATAPGPRVAEIEALGFTHFPLKMRRASRNMLREVAGFFDLVKLYKRLRPDIVHQVSIKPIIYGSLAARLAWVPAVVNAVTGLGFVFIAGGRRKKYLKKIIETAYRLAGKHSAIRFLFENPDDRQHFLARKIVKPEKAVLILGSGVAVERFRPKTQDRDSEVLVVLLAARMLWHKGIKEFVEAARILRKKGLRAEFWLAGMPDLSNPAAVPVSRLLFWHRQGDVRWLGFQKDMPALYQQAAIVCLPTRYREGIPVTLLEAAACGKPLVATDMPGCREIVKAGENGFLVKPGAVDELAAALERLLLDARMRQDFGLSGRRLVEKQFSDKKVIDDTFAVYRDLLGDKWPSQKKS